LFFFTFIYLYFYVFINADVYLKHKPVDKNTHTYSENKKIHSAITTTTSV